MIKVRDRVKLKELAVITRGGSPRPIDEYITSGNGYNWLRIGDVPENGKYITKVSAKIKPEGLSKTTLVRDGDFILSNSMSFGRPYIMKVDSCIHDGWLALKSLNRDKINRNYLYYLLLHPRTQYLFRSLSAGSGVQNLKKETVNEIEVEIPDIDEQRKIVDLIETWDDYLEKLDRKIELKKNIKKGLMQQLLTGKTRLPGLSGERQKQEIGELLRLSNTKVNPSKTTTDYKCIEMEHLRPVRPALLGTTKLSFQKSTKNLFSKGDILFGKLRPYLRKYLVAPFEGVCSSEIWVLKTTEKLDQKFAFQLVQTHRFIEIANVSSGSRMPRADWKYMERISIDIPTNLDEQAAIANILDKSDNEIYSLEKKRQLIADQKKYLLNNLVSGEIRVPEDMKLEGAPA